MEREGFEFCNFRFYPDESLLVRLQDGHQFKLTRQQSQFLTLLISKSGQLVSYSEIRKELWPEAGPRVKVKGTIREIKSSLCRHLKESASAVETIINKGYQLNAAVKPLHSETGEELAEQVPEHVLTPLTKEEVSVFQRARTNFRFNSFFEEHRVHVLVASILYALLFAEAVFLELAYRFDEYKTAAWLTAPVVFIWILGTTLVALKVASRFTDKVATGMAQATLILILAAALLFIALGLVLPQQPVTAATFQTYSAHAAYLKNIFYFLPLGILFVVVPFCLVVKQKKDESDTRLRVWHLVVLLGSAALVSFWLTSNLLNNVLPGPHLDLFIKLVEGRRILYFGLGLECVIWYYLNTGKPDVHVREFAPKPVN